LKTRRSSLLVIGVLLVLVACNVPSTSNSIATQGNPTSAPTQSTSIPATQIIPTIQSTPTTSSACANQYFPSTPGATWTYANTSPQAPPSTTVRTLTGITASGLVTHDVTTGDIQVDIKWSCKDGALAMLEEDSVSTITAGNLNFEIGSVKASGYLLPAALKAGQTWSETLEITSNGYIDGAHKAIQSNETQIDCTANGQESVKVASGSFNAFKVTCIYTITATTDIDGETTPAKPVTNTITITDWYVSGVGSAKTEKTGDITETKELTSYSIP